MVERGIVQQTRRYVRACGSRAEWKREEEVRGREEEGGACDPRFKKEGTGLDAPCKKESMKNERKEKARKMREKRPVSPTSSACRV